VSQSVVSSVLPVVLALVMVGLGLSLTISDFRRVLTVPSAVAVALFCQLVLLPAVCFGLVVVFGLPSQLAIGMMVLAATPGGPTAAVFSHLAGGDVAFNVTLTAINSALSLVVLPLLTVFAVEHFAGVDATVGVQPDKLVQVMLLVVVPISAGMVVRYRHPDFARRMQRPVRIASSLAVLVAISAAVFADLDGFLQGVVAVGLVCVLFSVLSLSLGYIVPRLLRVEHGQAVAVSMEIGIHNAVFAITMVVSVLDMPAAAAAPATYGTLMYFTAAVAARLAVRYRVRPTVGASSLLRGPESLCARPPGSRRGRPRSAGPERDVSPSTGDER
jgi:BASS family bile acid:Na+ symporter